jgi:cyclopropane fatty-acyl-phospholipid synthase-like methyltransferase
MLHDLLDVGHADGDSLLLQLNHPDVPKPSSVTGITSIKSQHVRASERLQLATSRKPGKIEVKLYQGDAVFRPSATSSHPLDPNSDIPAFTTIIALDCAYHFRSRYTFLSQCFRRLESGGKIALGDMCLSSSNPAPSLKRSLIQMAMSIPSENMIPKAQYRDQLEELGYQDIVIEDVSNDVFGPFADFLGKRGIGWWLFSKILRAWWKTGVAFVMVSATKP